MRRGWEGQGEIRVMLLCGADVLASMARQQGVLG